MQIDKIKDKSHVAVCFLYLSFLAQCHNGRVMRPHIRTV